MRILAYILVLCSVFYSCGGPKDLASTKNPKEVIEPKPEWVDNRPVSQSHYIGIGSASKKIDPLDFASKAKSNALNDLASEISVTIKGESFMNTLEVNMNFQEQFISQVNSYTEEYVEGFDVVGSWQDQDVYYIYYRLSKAKHAEIKNRLKKETLSASYDSYKRAKADENRGDITSAIDNYLGGLQNMEVYWNEPNLFTLDDGSEIYLDNEIFHSVTTLINSLDIIIPMSEILLSSNNDYSKVVGIKTMVRGNEVGNIPLIYNFDQGKYTRNKPILTNNEGLVSITVNDVDISKPDNSLMVAIDLDKLLNNFRNDKLMKGVTDKFLQKVTYVPITVEMPKLFVESYETNLGNQLETSHLANALKNKLGGDGMVLAGAYDSSDYLIQIKSSTNKGGTSQGFHVVYLEFEVEVRHRMTEELIYQKSMNQIKGLQLNFDAAGMEAYKKAAKIIEKDLAKDIIESIL